VDILGHEAEVACRTRREDHWAGKAVDRLLVWLHHKHFEAQHLSIRKPPTPSAHFYSQGLGVRPGIIGVRPGGGAPYIGVAPPLIIPGVRPPGVCPPIGVLALRIPGVFPPDP
jgi:hypothetical protein